MRRIAIVPFILLYATTCFTQASHFNSSNIYNSLQKFNVLGSVLYIGATPADENIPLLSYLSNVANYRTGFLSITRGENLKNQYGYEQGLEAGIIHVSEGAAAGKIENVERYYTSAWDISFTRTEKQARESWNEEKVLSDLVWIIRNFQPDVIITRYAVADSLAYNGQGRFAASLIEQAYKLAADTTAFTDQLKYGISEWKAKRLLYDNPHSNTNIGDAFTFNPVTGIDVNDIVQHSRQLQKTIYNKDTTAAAFVIPKLTFIQGDGNYTNIMDGINTTWDRFTAGSAQHINRTVDSVIAQYNFLQPSASVKGLTNIYNKLYGITDSSAWRAYKIAAMRKILMLCSGINAIVTSNQAYAVAGDSLTLTFSIQNNGTDSAGISRIHVPGFDTAINATLLKGQRIVFTHTIAISSAESPEQPYWLRDAMKMDYMYNITEQPLVGKEQNDDRYSALFLLNINNMLVTATTPITYKTNNSLVNSNTVKNVTTILPVIVSLSPDVILTNVKPANDVIDNAAINIVFKTNINYPQAKIKIRLVQLGFTININGKAVGSSSNNELFEKDTILDLTPGQVFGFAIPLKSLAAAAKGNISNLLGASVTLIKDDNDRKLYSSFYKVISYNYLAETGYYVRQVTKIVPDEIKTAGKAVGFIYSDADRVFFAVKQMGYNVKTLDNQDFIADSLKKYTTIIAGSNIDDIQKYLGVHYDAIIDYVKNGGNFILLNQVNAINLTQPFTLISNAQSYFANNSTIALNTAAKTPLFNYPNTLTPQDFTTWKSDLNKFVFSAPDTSFITPLVITDKEKNSTTNALLIKPYYKGNFIFSGLSLSNQLAGGIPGAYKLLANMIAYNETKYQIKPNPKVHKDTSAE